MFGGYILSSLIQWKRLFSTFYDIAVIDMKCGNEFMTKKEAATDIFNILFVLCREQANV